ncbi:hypothetical protein PoB_002282400 [Plakobranchus ocellatus]|uniref:Uncharacterized protein n=1 Tax=Plakobranchus ocellatus TaxID=259542 RepID=A0AAV3ZPM2_9GAST|nr:hypothetical protein PoB_002282400 [Plakobranchus ocellatus]
MHTVCFTFKVETPIQKQVQDLETYFDDLLTSFAEDKVGINICESCSRRAQVSTLRDRTKPQSENNSEATNFASLNRTHHCLNTQSSYSEVDARKSSRRQRDNDGTDSASRVSGVHSRTAGDAGDARLLGQNHMKSNTQVFETKRSASNEFSSGPATYRTGENGDERQRILPAKTSREKTRGLLEKSQICSKVDEIRDFQLNMIPLVLTDSTKLVINNKADHGEGLNTCSEFLNHFSATSVMDFDKEGVILSSLDRCNLNSPRCAMTSLARKGQGCDADIKTTECFKKHEQSEESCWESWIDPRMPCDSIDSVSRAEMTRSRMDGLIAKVQSMGLSLRERRIRVNELRKSNTILEEQITEVQTTLKSFDSYLNTVKTKPYPIPPEAVKKEMYVFQEAIIEKIFFSVQVLSEQIKVLRKTEQTKFSKVKALLSKYDAAKEQTPEALCIPQGIKNSLSLSSFLPRPSIKTVCSDFVQSLQAVIAGIEQFHTSFEDIWDEAMGRASSELDNLFLSLPRPFFKRWTPDDPNMCTSLASSSLDSLEQDMSMLKMPEDMKKYGPVLVFSLRILERVSNEFSHLMIITRIKDLQIISIDHSIGMAYMSMKQIVLQNKKKCSNTKKKTGNRKRSSFPCRVSISENKRKGCLSEKLPKQDSRLRLPDLARHEEMLKRRLCTNSNKNKRTPNHYSCDDQEYADGYKEAHMANKIHMSTQLETDNAHHMGSAIDMKLPSIHLEDCTVDLHDVSSSQSNGFSPWIHPKASGSSQNNQSSEGKPETSPSNLSSRMLGENVPTSFSVHQFSRQSLTNTNDQPKLPTVSTRTRNYTDQPVESMENTVAEKKKRTPIQYCSVLPMPTPLSASLIKSGQGDKSDESITRARPESKFHRSR